MDHATFNTALAVGAAGASALLAFACLRLMQQNKPQTTRADETDAEARIQALSDRVNKLTANLLKLQQTTATAQPQARAPAAGMRPEVELRSSICTEGAWFDGAPEVQYELLSCPDYVEMAESLVLRQPNRFRYQ